MGVIVRMVFLQTVQSQLNRRQGLAGFIVQFAGDTATLLFLALEKLFGKLTQFLTMLSDGLDQFRIFDCSPEKIPQRTDQVDFMAVEYP